MASGEHEPVMPARPAIPDPLEPFVDDSLSDPRYSIFPLSKAREQVLTRLSQARLPTLVGALLLYLANNLVTFFLSGQPIT
jgi:hypothetical protein